MKQEPIPSNHENKKICSECEGECCRRFACLVFPCDFSEITIESIRKKLKEGYCFDYWEGNPTKYKKYDNVRAYYMRPRHKDEENSDVVASWGGVCVFLTENGCSLPESERPSGGKALIPIKTMNCDLLRGWSKQDCATAWLKYRDIIRGALR